jgi:hypothetical protein
MEEASLSPYLLMHAFAEGRWRAAGRTGQHSPQIFAFSGNKKVKAHESERRAFKQLFPDIPHNILSDWGVFTSWMDGPTVVRTTGPFTDNWLLQHLHELEWLGNAWRDSGDGVLVLSVDQGALTLLGRAYHLKPSHNVAFTTKMATPFFPPSWPEGALDSIKAALLAAVAPAALMLKGAEFPDTLLTTDPLELEYPLIIDPK